MTDSVTVIIESQDKRLLVHQRPANARYYPNLFRIGIDARIEPGESNEEAIARRLIPLGISTTPEYLFCSIRSCTPKTREHVEVYRMVREALPVDKKLQRVEWMNIKQIDELLEKSALCPLSASFYPTFRDRYVILN